MGNYVLKTADDYKVPESQRVNPDKKRRQMFLLEESVHAIKMEFTSKVLALRDFRQKVKKSILKDLVLLRQLGGYPQAEFYQKVLEGSSYGARDNGEESMSSLSPAIRAIFEKGREYPERRFDFTEEDIELFRREQAGEKIDHVEKVNETRRVRLLLFRGRS
jgi:hypothetical protein